jgi:hypothetical protein
MMPGKLPGIQKEVSQISEVPGTHPGTGGHADPPLPTPAIYHSYIRIHS